MISRIHDDESPLDLAQIRQKFPRWMQRFLPHGGGNHRDEQGKTLFGFVSFLLSESIVFVSLFITYSLLRLGTLQWLPPEVTGPQLTPLVILNSGILLTSSLVIFMAERALDGGLLGRFRLLWLLTSGMGVIFLIGEAHEWALNDFSLSTGVMGGTYYLLTGFHGLHVSVGILLQLIMLKRSFLPNNYLTGHVGVTAASLFWHFVDVIWIVLVLLIYVW